MKWRQSGRDRAASILLPWTLAALQNAALPAGSPPASHCQTAGGTAVNKWIQGTVTALTALALTSAAPASAPGEIAGVAIPRTPLALKTEAFVQAAEPDFLFNHS